MKRSGLFVALGLCIGAALVIVGAASAVPAPPVLSAPAKIVYPTLPRLQATIAPGSLPATFTVERSPDASAWATTAYVRAVTDTRTTAVDFTIWTDRNAYWRIAQRSGREMSAS